MLDLTATELAAISRRELISRWETSPPTELDSLAGECEGMIPNPGDERAQRFTAEVMFNRDAPQGYWLGKAVRRVDDLHGEGYNMWRRSDGSVWRFMQFHVREGTSLIDGQPALLLDYSQHRHPFLPDDGPDTLIDEMRTISPGVHVGLGTRALDGGSRSSIDHFILRAPLSPWVGPDRT